MNRISSIVLLLMFVITACNVTVDGETTQEVTKPIECPEVIPAPKAKPKFLESVFPVGSISKAEYDHLVDLPDYTGKTGGIEATVATTRHNSKVVSGWAKNVSLIVDGLYANSPVRVEDGLMPQGPYYYHWAVNLDLGYHEAIIVANLDTGERVEYSWMICIVP